MEATAREITKQESRGALALWFGVLTGPLAWSLHLGLSYMTEDFISCAPGSSTKGEILGASVESAVIAINSVLVLITAIALVVAIVSWRRSRTSGGDAFGGRPRWMALVGIMNGVLFGLIIVLGFVPPLVLDVCRSPL